jgi:hypothetical protein
MFLSVVSTQPRHRAVIPASFLLIDSTFHWQDNPRFLLACGLLVSILSTWVPRS